MTPTFASLFLFKKPIRTTVGFRFHLMSFYTGFTALYEVVECFSNDGNVKLTLYMIMHLNFVLGVSENK